MAEAYVADGPTQEIGGLLTYQRWRAGLERRFTQLDYLTRSALGSKCLTGVCDEPQKVTQYLHEARVFIETEAHNIAARYSPFRWLWYLRRLPSFVFAGRLKSTAAYDSALAECVSGRSRASSPFRVAEDGSCRYRVKNDVIEVLIAYSATIIYLSRIHTNLRWVGKGASIRFDLRDSVVGDPQPTEELAQAVRIYDERCDEGGDVLSRIGTTVAGTGGSAADSVLAVQLADESYEELMSTGGSEGLALVHFSPRRFSLESLTTLHRDGRVRSDWHDPLSPTLLMLLRAMLRFHLRSRLGFSSVQMRGYSVLEKRELLQTLADSWYEGHKLVTNALQTTGLPANPTELIETARNYFGSLWPLHPGPPIRTEGNLVCCDLYTATGHLMSNLEFPGDTGEMANARSKHFEVAVQARIDETPWRPDGDRRNFIHRTIRAGGDKITDLDALGQHGDTLLLVSCKSKIYSARYDAGDFQVVRNYASEIEKAVQAWLQKVQTIRTRPLGDNYDFRSFRTILGVVVLPHVFYVPRGIALRVRCGWIIRRSLSLGIRKMVERDRARAPGRVVGYGDLCHSRRLTGVGGDASPVSPQSYPLALGSALLLIH